MAYIGAGVLDVNIAGDSEAWLQLCPVNLGNCAHTERLLIELVKYVFEIAAVKSFSDDALRGMEGVGGSIGVELGHNIAHLVGEDVGPRGSPLAKLEEWSVSRVAQKF